MSEYPPDRMATPADTLAEQITNPNFPKNEREWWASHEIARLRALNAELLEALEYLQLTCEGDGEAFEEAYKAAKVLIAKETT